MVKITVPEGFTAVQIADVLQKAGLECYGDFLHEAETYAPFPYMYGPEAAKVKGEGFLLPIRMKFRSLAPPGRLLT